MEVPASLKALLPSGPDRQESLPGIIDTHEACLVVGRGVSPFD